MDLQRLKELYAAATPGPWLFDKDGEAGYGNYHGDENVAEWQRLFFTDELGAFRLADIELISALHAAFPAILKRLRAADIFAEAIKGVMEEGGHLLHTEQALADYEKAIK